MNKNVFPGSAMYRFTAVLIIIFFSISAFSVDSRMERWNLRIEKLKKIQSEASSGKVDKTIINGITGDEIKSSEEFLALLNRYKKEDGSLKSESKKYPLTEIEKKLKDISLPAISLYYLSDLYKTVSDTQVKDRIAVDILQYAEKKINTRIKISQAESRSMAEMYILEKGMAEFESTLNAATTDLLSKTEYELSRSDYNSNEADISKIIQKHIETTLSGKRFFEDIQFNEKYLATVPQWKFIMEQHSNAEARDRAVMNFVFEGGGSLKNTAEIKDVSTAEEMIFTKAKEKISDLLQNTTPGNGASGNNPYYEIPDVKKLGLALDEIDRYRKTLIETINGSENKDLVAKLKSNNAGIAARSINKIDAQFKSEEARIERLKKIKGDIIIYNEELFKASKTHFYEVREELYRYADLSADFLEAMYSSGKNDPQKYIDLYKYRSERYILYISFSEKLTANTLTLSGSGSEKLHTLYKGTIPKVLAEAKNFLKPEAIPVEIRETLKREQLKEYASINADCRIKGSQLISTIRKNFDESTAGFSRSASLKKESASTSEIRIGQDETDRLFSYAKKCSNSLAAMNYAETVFKKYRDEYIRISDELKKGNKIVLFAGQNSPESFFASLPGFNAETIDKETATREILEKEGMDALSGSITLVQYYKKKGFPINFTPTNEEIVSMKKNFSKSPEIIVSSWRMNGKNFRQIDINVVAELKKLINKNAWNNNKTDTASEIFDIDETGIKISFTPPSGWKKISASGNDHIQKISFQSPDLKGVIEMTSICEEEHNLQTLVASWPEKSGFSMIEKNWGKKNNSDYIKSTAKNRYDGIMESYMIAKKGHVIILSGKTTGDMYRQLNKTLADIFNNLEIKESSI